MKKIDLLEVVSSDLGLSFIEQDWGIINGSSGRMEEFIKYYNSYKYFPETIKYQLFELIIASFNEDLLEGSVTKEKELLFKKFIQQHSNNITFEPILTYWKKISDKEEFPVGKLLS
ncbi:MAG: hypothetical protein WCD44_03610 [Candidatus Babeliales bacterium]